MKKLHQSIEEYRDVNLSEDSRMRRGEICGLMWSDFDGKKGTLTVRRTLHQHKGGGLTTGETKTGKDRRTITLPPSTAQSLQERRKGSCSQWIFPNPLRPESPVSPGSAYNHMKTLLKSAGLPRIRFHDLRHPYVSPRQRIFSIYEVHYLLVRSALFACAIFYGLC